MNPFPILYLMAAAVAPAPPADELTANIRPEYVLMADSADYFIARKHTKLYMTSVFESSVRSITTDAEQHLYLDGKDAEMMKGKRVLIVDDVISTGESLRALEELVDAAGGNIVGKMTILAEGDAQEREDIIYLEKLPLFNAKGDIIG